MNIDKIRLKKLAEAATQGPWCWDKGEDPRPNTYGIATDADPECMVVNQDFGIELKEDAYFIAAASPATVLALLAEIERLEVAALAMNGARAMDLIAERDQLKAENEALRKDAERYRWLREKDWIQVEVDVRCGESETLPEMDALIDAAMAKEASHG